MHESVVMFSLRFDFQFSGNMRIKQLYIKLGRSVGHRKRKRGEEGQGREYLDTEIKINDSGHAHTDLSNIGHTY